MNKRLLNFLDSKLAVYIIIGIAVAIACIPLYIKIHYLIKYW